MRKSPPSPAATKAAPRRKAKTGPSVRTRLPAAEREEMIMAAAMDFIAEKGFNADTGELARRAGVSHGLVFRYFGNKETLIERVYERNFLARWHEDWEEKLADRSVPLRDRLKAFYRSYFRAIDEYSWIRISMFSGLNGHDLTRRYIEVLVARVLSVIARETRFDRDGSETDTPSEEDLEIAWHLHSTFIYTLIRRYIFEVRTLADTDAQVEIIVDRFLDGAVPG